jgi:hypothetical protein
MQMKRRDLLKQYRGKFLALLRKIRKNVAQDSGCHGHVGNRPLPGASSKKFFHFSKLAWQIAHTDSSRNDAHAVGLSGKQR